MKKHKKNKASGITLIALVVTIIVLLILAGISIQMLTGDNGILTRAGEAKVTTDEKQIKEKIRLSYLAALTGGKGQVTEGLLVDELDKEFGQNKYELSEDLTKVTIDGKEYEIGGTVIPEEKVATLPSKEGTKPFFPSAVFHQLPGTTLENGLVITDAEEPTDTTNHGNEYVWIEVPNKNITGEGTISFVGPDYPTTLPEKIETLTSDQRTIIKEKILKYTENLLQATGSDNKTTKLGWVDEYYDGCGIASPTAYNTLYDNMLKSVYNHGGFWIGRYEAGQDVGRAEVGDISNDLKPYSKFDKIPIMRVTCSQAQTLATRVENIDSQYNSSLMFGVQWDCVLKYLQEKNAVDVEGLTKDSSNWGNYSGVETTITRGRYWNFADSYPTPLFKDAGTSHTRPTSGAPECFSTGAIPDNMAKQNIFDLAGNIWEWTLERATSSSGVPCSYRGGVYGYTGSDYPASYRFYSTTGGSSDSIGFRVSLY